MATMHLNRHSIYWLLLAFLFPFLKTVAAMAVATASQNTKSVSTPDTMEPSAQFDVVIVGGGSAGLTAAKLIGPTLGKTCCIIEQAKMGGDCTWTGCIPSKSLIHASKQKPPITDFALIKEQISKNIQQIYKADDSPEALNELGGIEVISGAATLLSSKLVSVYTASEDGKETSRTIQAKEGIILCTGSAPKLPSTIPGLTSYYTYESLWDDLMEIPKRLTIIGGGPIGCELAQAMARFGSQVTLITSSVQLLPQEDPEVGKLLHDIFTKKNQIQIIYGTVKKVEQPQSPASQSHTVYIESKASPAALISVQGDAILVAIGREPRCRGMGLEAIGVHLSENQDAIAVNAQLETSVKGIYAAGDCTGDRQFTHYAGYQGAIAARNILLPFSDPGILPNVPSTIYTSPEIAAIGLSEAKAFAQYGSSNIVIYQRHLSHVDRAVCDDAQEGFIKVICLKKSNVIIGATIVAPVAGEMIAEIAVLMRTKMPFDQLATVMHPYPTYSMALQLMAAEVYYEKTKKLKWLLDFLKWLGL